MKNTAKRKRARLSPEQTSVIERVVSALNMSSAKLEAIKEVMTPMAKAANQEVVLDRIMDLISDEVIKKTLSGLELAERTAAARLLLKRADQRRVDRRLDMVQSGVKESQTDSKLTPEEKQERIRQIFGIS